jgi:hypothetical protein
MNETKDLWSSLSIRGWGCLMKVQSLLLVIILPGLSAFAAQAPHIPTHLQIEAPKNVSGGQGTLNIKLLDAKGQPIQATSDLKFTVKASEGQSQQTVVIHKGDTSADVAVSKSAPGLSNFHVESADPSAIGLAGNTQIGFTPESGYHPVPPLSLLLTVQPGVKLITGEPARVIVRYVDSHKVPIPAQSAIKVGFPGLGELMSPASVNIPAGELYGEATLSSSQPQLVSLNPVASPPISVDNQASTVEFVSPIVATRVVLSQTYVKAIRHPRITLTVGFMDSQGNWIAPDQDRVLILQVDPPSAGMLALSSITVPKGQQSVSTTFVATQEGTSKIKAVSRDVVSEDSGFEFHYGAVYFWLIAAVGGLIGGGVRNALGSDHSVKKIVVHLAGGLMIGVVTYLIAPLLVGLSLKPAGLENGSKIFEAFAWGFLGGGSGITILARIFYNKSDAGSTPPRANAATVPQ